MKIIAMVPARIGSQRLKKKNLALINNKPLVYYAINAAKKSKIFDKIFINSDDKIFGKVAKKFNVDFYLRPKHLGSSNTKSDDIVFDFLNNFDCDILVWVNSIAPLQTASEIKKVVNFFKKGKYNSLITANEFKYHGIINNKPINFKRGDKFSKTQDLTPIDLMVYSLMMWKSKSFKKAYKEKKGTILHGKVGFYNVSRLSGLIVKNKLDLQIVSAIINKRKDKIKYFK